MGVYIRVNIPLLTGVNGWEGKYSVYSVYNIMDYGLKSDFSGCVDVYEGSYRAVYREVGSEIRSSETTEIATMKYCRWISFFG